jgi:hypothetical protein
MTIREIKGAPNAVGGAPANGSVLEVSARQPPPRRLVGYMSVAEFDVSPRRGGQAVPAADQEAEERRLPGHMSIVEFDRPPR